MSAAEMTASEESDRHVDPCSDPCRGELIVTWHQYHRLIEHLALQLHHNGHPFDQIVALSRGGLRVGDTLSRLFQRPLVVMAASSYSDSSQRDQGELRLGQQLAHTCDNLGPRVLLVDDLADSGATLAASQRWLYELPGITTVQTAVLWLKACSSIKPTLWAMELPGNPWVVQPFERWEQLQPENLTPWSVPQE